jgi:hypothetical protein
MPNLLAHYVSPRRMSTRQRWRDLAWLTEDQIHTLAVALAVLRDNIIERDGDLRLCPQIDELGDKILQSEWYRKVVLGVERK